MTFDEYGELASIVSDLAANEPVYFDDDFDRFACALCGRVAAEILPKTAQLPGSPISSAGVEHEADCEWERARRQVNRHRSTPE